MARTPRRLANVRARFQAGQSSSRLRARPGRVREGLDEMEVLTAVCKLFCKGHTIAEIIPMAKVQYGLTLSREEPYQYISYAASEGWLQFLPSPELALRQQIEDRCSWLRAVEVVHTAVFDDVAYRGAQMLLRLLKTHHAPPYKKEVVHVGFAGGHSVRKLALAFAKLLRRPADDLPETVVFHALVAGFNVEEPSTSPSAFFTYFVKDPALQIETRFVALHAPALVKTSLFAGLKSLAGIKEAYRRVEKLDIIVTSASLWHDEHNMLHTYMSKSKASMKSLTAAKCAGDMLWRPIGRQGPIEVATDIRAMTLLELSDLPKLIDQGKHVLLALGPCGACGVPKAEMLDIILGVSPPLITHLVVDSRTARGVFKQQA